MQKSESYSNHKFEPQEDLDAASQYDFAYSVHDEKTGDIKSQHETREKDGKVKGVYEFIEPDGYRRTVHYYVEKDSGFIAKIERKFVKGYKLPEVKTQNREEESDNRNTNDLKYETKYDESKELKEPEIHYYNDKKIEIQDLHKYESKFNNPTNVDNIYDHISPSQDKEFQQQSQETKPNPNIRQNSYEQNDDQSQHKFHYSNYEGSPNYEITKFEAEPKLLDAQNAHAEEQYKPKKSDYVVPKYEIKYDHLESRPKLIIKVLDEQNTKADAPSYQQQKYAYKELSKYTKPVKYEIKDTYTKTSDTKKSYEIVQQPTQKSLKDYATSKEKLEQFKHKTYQENENKQQKPLSHDTKAAAPEKQYKFGPLQQIYRFVINSTPTLETRN